MRRRYLSVSVAVVLLAVSDLRSRRHARLPPRRDHLFDSISTACGNLHPAPLRIVDGFDERQPFPISVSIPIPSPFPNDRTTFAMKTPRRLLLSRAVTRLWALGPPPCADHESTSALLRRLRPKIRRRAKITAIFCPVPGAAHHALHSMWRRNNALCIYPLSALSLRDRESALTSPAVFRFLFVRHPFLRLLAAYRRGVTPSSGAAYPVAAHVNSTQYREFMSKAQTTLQRTASSDGSASSRTPSTTTRNTVLSAGGGGDDDGVDDTVGMDDAFRAQSRLCAVNVIDYAFIGRMERFARDVHHVNGLLNIRSATLEPLRNSSGAAAAAEKAFHDHRVRHRASRLAEADLRAFGYSSKSIPSS